MELLVVLAIIALVGGLSAGAFHIARRTYALAASASQVEAILRAARNASIMSGIPARVEIETEQAVAYGFEAVGEWGFETAEGGISYGARYMPATLQGSATLGEGYAGRGLHLGGGGYADCGAGAAFDFRTGVYAEAWIRHNASSIPSAGEIGGRSTTTTTASSSGLRRRRTLSKGEPILNSEAAAGILSKGRAFFLGICPDGSLEGRIGDYRIRSMPGTVLPGRWTKVALSYDGQEVLLLADGIDRETVLLSRTGLMGEEEPRPPMSIPRSQESFLMGHPKIPFQGAVDEVRLYGMPEPLRYELGGRERILGWKKVIWFDRNGRLDSRFHELGVQLVLYEFREPPSSLKTEAAVDYSLTFEEWAERRGLAIMEGQREAAEAKLLSKIGEARMVTIAVDPSGALR